MLWLGVGRRPQEGEQCSGKGLGEEEFCGKGGLLRDHLLLPYSLGKRRGRGGFKGQGVGMNLLVACEGWSRRREGNAAKGLVQGG